MQELLLQVHVGPGDLDESLEKEVVFVPPLELKSGLIVPVLVSTAAELTWNTVFASKTFGREPVYT